jgi:16S rRNA processing protein RimM
MASQSPVRLGVLVRPQGLDGALRLSLDVDAVPTIATPCDAWLGYSETFLRPVRLERADSRGGSDLVCRFEGVSTIQHAEPLVDQALFLSVEQISYPDPFANPVVIGYAVQSDEGAELGEIDGIIRTPGHYVWSILNGGKEWLLPATSEFVRELRHEERRVIVHLIPGLFDDESEGQESE